MMVAPSPIVQRLNHRHWHLTVEETLALMVNQARVILRRDLLQIVSRELGCPF